MQKLGQIYYRKKSQSRFLSLIVGAAMLIFFADFWGLYAQTAPNLATQRQIILLKFKASSRQYEAWQLQNRTGALPWLRENIGNHRTEPLYDDGLINSATERFRSLTEDIPEQRTAHLRRWCVVEYSGQSNPATLAAKLRLLPDVEYAEAATEAQLYDIPNDPEANLQYHLSRIQALEAWDIVQAQGDLRQNVVIAVIDCGIDYRHEDLAANIFINSGEDGIDAQGRSKRTNNIDDDQNGRVDDWQGWDFAGADGRSEDNDPLIEGNNHATHVAGIAAAVTNNRIGVAGVARNVKLLNLKASAARSRTVPKVAGARALLYAAIMRSAVINCSWGDVARSLAEEEVVNTATELGSLVVAAAGNSNRFEPNYPAAYKPSCSVVWLEQDDLRLSGNYHETTDIGAPGTAIYSTLDNNRYGLLSGSSMSSPMVAAAAALVKLRFPRLTGQQIKNQLLATTDNIDASNRPTLGLIGMGRLNVRRAVETENPAFIEVAGYRVEDENNNGLLESGERVRLWLHLANGRTPVNAAQILMRTTIESNSRFLPFWDDTLRQVPSLAANETRMNAVLFTFRLTTNLFQNFEIPLLFSITNSTGNLIGRHGIRLQANLSYQTMAANNVIMTVNSRGSYGFNDFPSNNQGDGVSYKPLDSLNLLYEGGLIIASGEDSISSAARETVFAAGRSFVATSLLTLKPSTDSSFLVGKVTFEDLGARKDAGVSVEQTLEQYRQNGPMGLITTSYIITNKSARTFPKLNAGIFFDWDIAGVRSNETFWDNECGCGIAKNLAPNFPIIGVKLLSPQKPSFYPIQANDTLPNAITLDFDFPPEEQYRTLANGIVTTRKTGDVSNVVGGESGTLKPSESVMMRFGIAIGLSVEEIRRIFRTFDQAASATPRLYPNPAGASAFLEYELANDERVSVELLNSLGQTLAKPVDDVLQPKGWHQASFVLTNFAKGLYFVRFRSDAQSFSRMLIISE